MGAVKKERKEKRKEGQWAGSREKLSRAQKCRGLVFCLKSNGKTWGWLSLVDRMRQCGNKKEEISLLDAAMRNI